MIVTVEQVALDFANRLRCGQMNRMEYHVDLLKDDGATICGSTALVASNNVEAIEKAKHWAASLTRIAEDAWLQINLNGIGIQTLRLGEF